MSEQNILDVPAGEPAAENNAGGVPQPTPGSILENQPAPAQLDLFPEEFRVMNGEQLDVNASATKLAEAYQARAAFGAIPANDEEYAAPEGFDKWDEIKQLDAVKQFSDEAKKLGFTNEQFAFALRNISQAELDGRGYYEQTSREDSERQLREEWRDPNSYDLNLKQANKAVTALIPAAERNQFLGRYGNDASIIKMLARIGGELSEDQAAGILAPVPTAEDLKSLMNSEAYLNSKHPEHAATMRKVEMYYAKTYGKQAAY